MTTPKKKTARKSTPKAAKPAAKKAKAAGPRLLQLKITLQWSHPEIWRRVVVPEDLTLDQFHRVIQIVMGWDDSHMHMFSDGKRMFAMRGYEDDIAGADFPEWKHTVGDVLGGAKRTLMYEYDFGDSWIHQIVREKLLPPDPAARPLVCLAGEQACPPDDCGGIGGYYQMLEALNKPEHQDYEWVSDFLDKDWDPEAFDLDKINRQLAPRRR